MKYICTLIFLLTSISSFTLEIKGINIPETLSSQGKSLILNGAGLRQKSIINLYVASLYTTSKISNAVNLINDRKEIVLRLDILSSFVGAKQLNQAILDGFKANHSSEELLSINDDIEKLQHIFSKQKIKSGTQIEFIFLNSKIVIKKDNIEIITFNNEKFKKGLLSIWLGKNPVDANLKNSLLSL